MNTFSVIYHKGGPLNFSWNRVLETFSDIRKARQCANTLARAGYLAKVHKTHLLEAIGFPETFEIKNCPRVQFWSFP